MPLFRFHRGGLDESLKTTVIVKNMEELKEVIKDSWFDFLDIPTVKSNFEDFDVKVFIPYDLTLEQSFDKRCGWYQHYVSCDILEKGNFHMTGFLSEPME